MQAIMLLVMIHGYSTEPGVRLGGSGVPDRKLHMETLLVGLGSMQLLWDSSGRYTGKSAI